MNKEILKDQINQLFDEMVRIEHTAVGDENKVRNDLQRLLNELATQGGSDTQEFIKELSARPHHNLDFLVFCNNLSDKLNPPKELASELIHAVRVGDLDKIRDLIRRGADVNYVDMYHDFPLGVAAEKGDSESVKTLLASGAKVDVRGRRQETALIVAAREGHLEIAELLFEYGADRNAVNYDNDTPLHVAVEKGHKNVVLLLLSKGANPSLRGGSWNTPLHIAVRNGTVEIVRVLLSNGADINIFDGGAYTPLHWVILSQNLEIFRLLLEAGADPNAKANEREYSRFGRHTPLEWVESQLKEGELKETMKNMLRNHGAKQ